MATRSEVLSDIALLRQSLRRAGSPHLPLLKLEGWRPIMDILVDVAAICAALAVALHEPWTSSLALLVLGNRQRALGNILHDAAHRNLMRDQVLNDLVTWALIAPLLFVSLPRYRDLHFRHHLDLGAKGADPDLIPIPPMKARSWVSAVAVNALSVRAVLGSAFGHLLDKGVPRRERLYVLAWWALLVAALIAVTGAGAALRMLALWLAARCTVFHLITIVREMCDHHGLMPGGVFSFTRDLKATGLWSALIHPRNNAYHLTHHLLPAIPYYRLPDAQRLFATLPEYQERACVCEAYFSGPERAVASWQQEPAR
ncbi:MAG TPA: fatty acid desaturase [Ideonella sp.]|uniref:fatty acid desaturase family protein n=1 Tax=Ideonella sp. TaxID=1929293 RepID=UPI002CFEB8CC|nr:fatty acid desaturase [Ideonella sp.]HSI51860.1 fatty acid desaturase [Ideonella sp.]